METDILVRTTTTDGSSDLRYMTAAGRTATDAVAADREEMAEPTSDENPFQNPPVNDRSAGILLFFSCFEQSFMAA